MSYKILQIFFNDLMNFAAIISFLYRNTELSSNKLLHLHISILIFYITALSYNMTMTSCAPSCPPYLLTPGMCPLLYPELVADLAASVTCPVWGGPGTGGCCLMVVAPSLAPVSHQQGNKLPS